MKRNDLVTYGLVLGGLIAAFTLVSYVGAHIGEVLAEPLELVNNQMQSNPVETPNPPSP